jgi:sensor histidine kinase regulating citrate/malate metabolism
MLLLMTLLLALLVTSTLLITSVLVTSILEEYIGRTALNVSRAVSLSREVREGVLRQDSDTVQRYAEAVRLATGARFVVVGDQEGRRLSHPVPERIGKLMVGGDNTRALEEGEAYVSAATGTLGPSLRGKVPVFGNEGEVIGVVSVGYLQDTVQDVTERYLQRVLLWVGGLFLAGWLGTWFISRAVKRSIFGLEPEEIARLFRERNAILSSVREGILAINPAGEVTVLNEPAAELLQLRPDQALRQPIVALLPQTRLLEVLKSGEAQYDQETVIHGVEVIVNRLPMWEDHRVVGVVASFRRKQDIDRLVQELTQVQEYSEVLRAQTHEYSNKLHTLAGLIQLGSNREALELIGSETSGYQALLTTLNETVPDPLLSALILGKYNRGRELKVRLHVDAESRMSLIPPSVNREKLVSILGNLLENALEAAQDPDCERHEAWLSMSDYGKDLIFEVEDSGKGIAPKAFQELFERGVSTKTGVDRGIGLWLVQHHLEYLQGHLEVENSGLGGMRITVYIPKTPNIEAHEIAGSDRG